MKQSVILAFVLLTGLHAELASTQEPPSTEEVMREDAARLTPYSPSGATARRDTRGSPCVTSAPFELLACGPATTISLSLMPGIYGSMETTTTQGGPMAQIMDQLMAFGRATEPGTMSELARQEDAVDGSSINISIPLIDYGFQGSFGNAAITMNRANHREHYSHYQAVGPRDSVPGPGHAFPLSGNVTIEEYTPWVLRGSYSAQMVDLAQADLSVDDPVLPVIYNLSGSFNVIGPWRGDDRARMIEADDLDRTLQEDVAGFFGTVARGSAVPGAGRGGTASRSSPAGIASGGGASCDCSCNSATSAPPACQSRCEGTFDACRGEPVAMITDEQIAEAASLDARVAEYTRELRDNFEAHLEERFGTGPESEAVRESYLESFDNADNLDGRVSMTAGAGLPVECPPPEGIAERMKMSTLIYCKMAPALKRP